MGCGADELIDLLMRCVLDPGDSIVDCPPTFTMYVFDAAVNNARVVTVPRLEGFRLDVAGKPRSPSALFSTCMLELLMPSLHHAHLMCSVAVPIWSRWAWLGMQ